ncbi:MAG: hypothetical protein ACLTR6_06120 [Clostridium fessum]
MNRAAAGRSHTSGRYKKKKPSGYYTDPFDRDRCPGGYPDSGDCLPRVRWGQRRGGATESDIVQEVPWQMER